MDSRTCPILILTVYIGVYAYGESRFDLTFNPCDANIASLCPMNASVPIEASGIIPVSQSDVAGIPAIALSIPDFEGEAILRIFANSTQSEIGCYSAVVTNGGSFSQPKSVGTVLGVFTVIALLASFATAIYGDSVSVMRKHYAHSLSVLVVFSVFQHIFFTGVLSMNWPSVLVAWWSNFAWAGGMIYSASMQTSINHLLGNNIGNTSEVGAAGSGTTQESLGGGYDLSLIYKRGLLLERAIERRALANSSSGYSWYGQPVGPGFPLPGNYSGFAGTLAAEGIRVSNAFMTGFLWFLILLVIIVAAVVAFKWAVEALVAIKLLGQDRLPLFRQHWVGYTALAALRTLFIAFFMMMLLTIFQFSYDSSGGVKAIAAIIFLIFLIGIPGVVIYACIYRARQVGRIPKAEEELSSETRPDHESEPSAENLEGQRSNLLSKLRIKGFPSKSEMSVLARQVSRLGDESNSIHDDEDYVKKFGWLSARFRRTRWWFFTVWVLYEFIRACFYAGASGHPLTQVFGLLVVEFLAFCGIFWARPFEGQRLNVIVVYLLGFSKVATVALSSAFDVSFNLPRITTTIIGIAIIIIQGILTIATLIAIFVGAISSYFSLTRNRDEIRPKKWMPMREKYFVHLDKAAVDLPPPPPPIEEEPKGPYFNVASVQRVAKIEDEDPYFVAEMAMQDQDANGSHVALSQISATPGEHYASASEEKAQLRRNRAVSRTSMTSMRSGNLPYGARPHRPSWSTRDFQEWNADSTETPINMSRVVPDEGPRVVTPVRVGTDTPTRSATTTPVGRGPLRSATLPASMLRPMGSMDSLRVGGSVSTPDTIGVVPSPTVKPRSGTFNGRVSRAGSVGRSNTPTTMSRSGTPSSRLDLQSVPPRMAPLTPALEKDELTREFTRESAK